LPLGADASIFARYLEIAVAGNFGCLDRTVADLLTPCNIGAAKRVWPESWEVAAFRLRRLMKSIANT
jgi:hypothetical protein